MDEAKAGNVQAAALLLARWWSVFSDQRTVRHDTMGKWERALLKRLEREPAFDPVSIVNEYNDRTYSAINRAAHSLARKGLADVHRVWLKNDRGRRSPYLWLFRCGVTPADVELEPAVTQYERRQGST